MLSWLWAYLLSKNVASPFFIIFLVIKPWACSYSSFRCISSSPFSTQPSRLPVIRNILLAMLVFEDHILLIVVFIEKKLGMHSSKYVLLPSSSGPNCSCILQCR
ncbi:hypothetical protein GGS21DRAFT_501373 [Xylaria nigripes]|nr:hypothetical protein GGS21DRAFT_501373 [Xylaria nigripes]